MTHYKPQNPEVPILGTTKSLESEVAYRRFSRSTDRGLHKNLIALIFKSPSKFRVVIALRLRGSHKS